MNSVRDIQRFTVVISPEVLEEIREDLFVLSVLYRVRCREHLIRLLLSLHDLTCEKRCK